VNAVVIDASVAVKWVVEEDGTAEALTLRRGRRLIAPDLLIAECANILWKKVRRRELSRDEALLAARLLQGSDIELVPARASLEAATRLAIDLDHPAYDCLYLVVAINRDCPFITADENLLDKLNRSRRPTLRRRVVPLRTMT
jgi:predicted nucleic acid-binding protein